MLAAQTSGDRELKCQDRGLGKVRVNLANLIFFYVIKLYLCPSPFKMPTFSHPMYLLHNNIRNTMWFLGLFQNDLIAIQIFLYHEVQVWSRNVIQVQMRINKMSTIFL